MAVQKWMACYRCVCILVLSSRFIISSIIRHQHLCGEVVNPIPNRKAILDAFAFAPVTACHFLIEKAKNHLSRAHLLIQASEMSRELTVCAKRTLDEYSQRDNSFSHVSRARFFNLDSLTRSQKIWPTNLATSYEN